MANKAQEPEIKKGGEPPLRVEKPPPPQPKPKQDSAPAPKKSK